jgi:hypothetical protein
VEGETSVSELSQGRMLLLPGEAALAVQRLEISPAGVFGFDGGGVDGKLGIGGPWLVVWPAVEGAAAVGTARLRQVSMIAW